MIHEATGTVTTYYGVDLDSPSHSDLSVLPLDRRVRQLVSGIDPMIGWYWTTHEGRIRVWFRDRQHAEQFRRSLFG